jgi:hypothetical protein
MRQKRSVITQRRKEVSAPSMLSSNRYEIGGTPSAFVPTAGRDYLAGLGRSLFGFLGQWFEPLN